MNEFPNSFGVFMKSTTAVSFSLVLLLFAQPCFAKSNDPSATAASELFGLSALSLVATPVLLTAGTGYMAGAVLEKTGEAMSEVGKSTGEIIKLVGSGGEALSELTSEAIETAFEAADTAPDVATGDSEVKVEINKKEIPLKVRKDYLQMNEKVKTE
jgi:hypothetical protein